MKTYRYSRAMEREKNHTQQNHRKGERCNGSVACMCTCTLQTMKLTEMSLFHNSSGKAQTQSELSNTEPAATAGSLAAEGMQRVSEKEATSFSKAEAPLAEQPRHDFPVENSMGDTSLLLGSERVLLNEGYEREKAAIKIQAMHRGARDRDRVKKLHKQQATRTTMTVPKESQHQVEPKPPEEKDQSTGHTLDVKHEHGREDKDGVKGDHAGTGDNYSGDASLGSEEGRMNMNEQYDREQAAIKIQALHRGTKERRRFSKTKGSNEINERRRGEDRLDVDETALAPTSAEALKAPYDDGYHAAGLTDSAVLSSEGMRMQSLWDQEKAATKIQAMHRGCRQRKKFAEMKHSREEKGARQPASAPVAAIEQRPNSDFAKDARTHSHGDGASSPAMPLSMVESELGSVQDNHARDDEEQQHRAAIKIQAMHRGSRDREQIKKLREDGQRREEAERKKKAEEESDRRAADQKKQLPEEEDKGEKEEDRGEKERAVVKIQAVHRGARDRQQAKRLRDERERQRRAKEEMEKKMQEEMKMRLREEERLRQELDRAAVKIQAVHRGVRDREETKRLRDERERQRRAKEEMEKKMQEEMERVRVTRDDAACEERSHAREGDDAETRIKQELDRMLLLERERAAAEAEERRVHEDQARRVREEEERERERRLKDETDRRIHEVERRLREETERRIHEERERMLQDEREQRAREERERKAAEDEARAMHERRIKEETERKIKEEIDRRFEAEKLPRERDRHAQRFEETHGTSGTDMEGYVSVLQRKSDTDDNKTWRRAYAVLSNATLRLYKSKTHDVAVLTLDTRGMRVSIEAGSHDGDDARSMLCLKAEKSRGKVLKMRAEDIGGKGDWVAALLRAPGAILVESASHETDFGGKWVRFCECVSVCA